MPPIRLPPPGSSQRTKKQKPRVSRTRVRLGRGHHVPLHRLLEGGSPEARGRPPSPGSSRRARDTASRRPPHALRGRARRRAGVGPPAVALAPRGRPPRPSLVSGPRPGRIRSLTTLQPQRCAPARPAPRADGLAVSGAHAWRWWPATNPQCPVEPPGPEKKNKKKNSEPQPQARCGGLTLAALRAPAGAQLSSPLRGVEGGSMSPPPF